MFSKKYLDNFKRWVGIWTIPTVEIEEVIKEKTVVDMNKLIDDFFNRKPLWEMGYTHQLKCPCGAECKTHDATLAGDFIHAHSTHGIGNEKVEEETKDVKTGGKKP